MKEKIESDITNTHAQKILNSLADGVFTVNEDMIITHFNNSAEEITQVPKDEALGQYCFNVFQSVICETKCPLRLSVETGENLINQNNKILRADSQEIPISLSTAVMRDDSGNVIGGVETFRDLSDLELLNSVITKDDEAPGVTLLNDAERHTIIMVLNKNNWNKSKTAIELGLDRTTLWRKMKKLGISQKD